VVTFPTGTILTFPTGAAVALPAFTPCGADAHAFIIFSEARFRNSPVTNVVALRDRTVPVVVIVTDGPELFARGLAVPWRRVDILAAIASNDDCGDVDGPQTKRSPCTFHDFSGGPNRVLAAYYLI
jgi:hypothetical protein